MSSSSSNSIKSKKTVKDGNKKKPQPSTSSADNSTTEKRSPEKDILQYAGISPDIIRNYAEQSMFESHLSDDVCNMLNEDINYKLRYILQDALLKARLTGKEVISSKEIEETFSSLSIEKVYGAPQNPNWVPFADLPGTGSSDQTFFYLEDNLVNLIELAEEETTEVQYGEVVLTRKWFPEPDPQNLAQRNYFTVACESVISNEDELRKLVLKDISENPKVGPITPWFYHFGYFILMKNITYDSLTLRALDLIETLENSPLSHSSVSAKQLTLLVRLLLQRLLLTYSSPDLLRRMCFTLSILCLRKSLLEMTIAKINQKLDALIDTALLPILTIIYYLGIDAVREIFLPQIMIFLDRVVIQKNNGESIHITLAIYELICKAEYGDTYVHNWFDYLIPNELVIYWKPITCAIKENEKLDMDFLSVKSKLIKIRRKIEYTPQRTIMAPALEEYFSLPQYNCRIKRTLDEIRMGIPYYNKQTHITVGKTSLLLSVLKSNHKNKFKKCCDHTLLSYVL